VALAAARWAEQQHVGAVLQSGVTGGERHDLRFRDHRHTLEVEGGERFADRQPGLGQMTLDAAPAAVDDLVLGKKLCLPKIPSAPVSVGEGESVHHFR
jgi:hypothetical protein